jgi:hypothetical protein
MKKSDIHKIIQEEIHEHMIEESITGWLIDKVANGFKWYANKKADYQYSALLGSKDFKSLASKFKMSEKDWDAKARQMISKDPKKFADILAYDVRKGSFGKYFK